MKHRPGYHKHTYIILLILAVLFNTMPVPVHALEDTEFPSLEEFTEQVMNGSPDEPRGLYIPGLLANEIVRQPEGSPAFVSPWQEVITLFDMAEDTGTHGLLAHNYLAGESFFDLEEGQSLHLIYGDGRTEIFVVRQFLRYQALSPQSVTGNFIDLETKERISASELFLRVYNRPGDVVLQTCIDADGNSSWGRFFVIAVPVDEFDPRSMPKDLLFQ